MSQTIRNTTVPGRSENHIGQANSGPTYGTPALILDKASMEQQLKRVTALERELKAALEQLHSKDQIAAQR
jgi:hypothetical protein